MRHGIIKPDCPTIVSNHRSKQAEIQWDELDEDAATNACRELLVGQMDAESDGDAQEEATSELQPLR